MHLQYCVSKLRHISEIKEVTALLDTRCLVGDCISQEIKKKKVFKDLIISLIHTTICSDFHNTDEK
jgi:hypothetical protein